MNEPKKQRALAALATEEGFHLSISFWDFRSDFRSEDLSGTCLVASVAWPVGREPAFLHLSIHLRLSRRGAQPFGTSVSRCDIPLSLGFRRSTPLRSYHTLA